MKFMHQKLRYSVPDLMFLLNSGRNAVYDAINSGKLDTYLVGRRRYASPAAAAAYAALIEREAREAQG